MPREDFCQRPPLSGRLPTSQLKPLLFITGFLGSGKTTLLRQLSGSLRNKGIQTDAILNDYVNAEMEIAAFGESLAHVVPLDSGCACCHSHDELISLCRNASEREGQILMIELNGTADPLPVLETFSLLDGQLPFGPRVQVCMVDARHWGNRAELTQLEKRQLETASFWILTHADKVDEEQNSRVISEIGSVSPLSSMTTPPEISDWLTSQLSPIQSEAIISPASRHREPGALKKDPVHRLAHQFAGISLPLPPKVRRHSIEQLINELPPQVIRAKAMVKLVEEPGCRWLYQKSGTDPIEEPIPVPNLHQVPASLICVGPGLDVSAIQNQIHYHFGHFNSEPARSLT